MDAYTTAAGRTVTVGDEFKDALRDARTLRVTAVDGPYADWRGVQRCKVRYVVVELETAGLPSPTRVIEADLLTDPSRFVRVEQGGDPR